MTHAAEDSPTNAGLPIAVGFEPPEAVRLLPETPLRQSDTPLRTGSVGDFWAWGFSDLRQNGVRGHLAEYIVAQALDIELKVRNAWDDYDLSLADVLVPYSQGGKRPARLQIKASGYLQAWRQSALSSISFAGLRRRPFPMTQDGKFKLGAARVPKADVFVFAIQMAKDHASYDALDLDQWEFRVLPAHLITQNTLKYPALSRMTAAVTFAGLATAVRVAARQRVQALAGALAQLTKLVSVEIGQRKCAGVLWWSSWRRERPLGAAAPKQTTDDQRRERSTLLHRLRRQLPQCASVSVLSSLRAVP